MKKVFKRKYTGSLLATGLALFVLVSCSKKWDEFKKYTDAGEIVYAGKLDSLTMLSGRNRVRIIGKLNADPKIATVKIFWNQNKDSAVYQITRGVTGNVFDQIFDVPEGITTFTVYTYDEDGNRSIPEYVVGKSYGENYRKRLSNRIISSIRYLSSSTTVNWEPADAVGSADSTEFQYAVGGVNKSVILPHSELSTVVDAFDNASTTIRYRTISRPEATCIDTFMVDFTELVVVPLKNNAVPFIAASKSGRWGNLADWNSNDAVKNHGGYGGWDEWNGNIFNIESGWGSPAVTNGKIWQTILLDPGSYTFRISDLMNTNLTSQDNAYLVAAQGTGLPDVADIASALGSVHVVTGKTVDDLKVQFSVSQQTEVSVGYLTSQPDGNPGRYCNIRAFSLDVNN